MKRFLIALLLLCSLAVACDINVKTAEERFSSGSYDDEVRLAEVYHNTALCFDEKGKNEKADFYFTKSGNYYVSSGQKLLQDFNLKAALFTSAGESYAQADLPSVAEANFEKAITLKQKYPSQVNDETTERAEKGLTSLNPVAPTKTEKPQTKPFSGLISFMNFNTPTYLLAFFSLFFGILVVLLSMLFLYSKARR